MKKPQAKQAPTAEQLDWAERGEQCVVLMLQRRFITAARAKRIRQRIKSHILEK